MPDPIARWDHLRLDALDAGRLVRFWAAVLGSDAERLRIEAVERPKQVKHRVHLDVHATSVADLETLGATVLAHEDDTGLDWTVMADPEGGEFCAFVSEHTPRRGLYAVAVDCVDAAAQAAWWAGVLGCEVDEAYAPEAWGVTQPPPAPPVAFLPVPEPRQSPNRVRWDVVGDVDALLAAGATRLHEQRGDTGARTVLADPEGNEFGCLQAG